VANGGPTFPAGEKKNFVFRKKKKTVVRQAGSKGVTKRGLKPVVDITVQSPGV